LLYRNQLPILLFIFFFAFSRPLGAQRTYVFGTSLDITGGGENRLTGSSIGISQNQPIFLYYGAYPSVSLNSRSSGSTLTTSYSYGFDGTRTNQNLNHHSHAGALSYSKSFSSEFAISFSESFQSTSDAGAFNAVRGIPFNVNTPFVFSPVSSQFSTRSNTASIGLTYRLSAESGLSFNVSHGLRGYGSANGSFGGALQNQQNVSGDVSYSYQTSPHETWTVSYSAASFKFSRSQDVYSQTAHTGYSAQLVPTLKLGLTVGVSDIVSRGAGGASLGSSVGLDSSVDLVETIHNQSIAVRYAQISSDASGLGSISSTRRGDVSYNYSGKAFTVSLDASAFDTTGILQNSFSARGTAATATIGVPLSKSWSLQGVAFYQKYGHTTVLGFTEKRIFASLRYSNPTLWKTSR